MTGRFLTPLCTQDLPGNRWLITAPFVYETAAGEIVTVPAGFVCDLTSAVPFADDGDWGAVVHDFLYTHPIVEGRQITRARADAIYREAMNTDVLEADGRAVPPELHRVRRFGRWVGVRVLGYWFGWRKHRAQERAEAFS